MLNQTNSAKEIQAYTGNHYHYYNRFMALWILSRATQVSHYQKCKTNLELLQQEMMSGCGISWAKCKSAPHPRQITTPASHHLVLTGWMPILPPNQQQESTECKTGNQKMAN